MENVTAKMIEERFEEAARTLRRLPNPPGSTPVGYRSGWPGYRHEPGLSYGYDKARVRVVPSPAAIRRMEECLEWLRWLDPEDARIVWLRAEGWRWRQICSRTGYVRQTAWRYWVAALMTIANRLNSQAKSGRSDGGRKAIAAKTAAKAAKDGTRTLF